MLKFIAKCFIVIETLLLISCSSVNKYEIKRLHNLNNQLVYSTKIIESQNQLIYRSLEDMLHDLKNMARANIWQPKALEIKSLAENFKTYILTLKKELQSESNERLDNFKTIFDEDNKTASHEIFIHKNETVKLNSHWENFVQNILKVDTNLNEQFKAELMISPNTDSTNKELQNYFENSTTIGALSTLSSYENRCVIIENMFITYCHSKIPTLDGCGFGKGPDILVYQNRNYIKPGEALVITAGIAQYSFESRPNIFINGKKLELERNGSAMYTMKANNKPGFYKIPVRIEFINANGDRVTKEKYVKYEIAPNQLSEKN